MKNISVLCILNFHWMYETSIFNVLMIRFINVILADARSFAQKFITCRRYKFSYQIYSPISKKNNGYTLLKRYLKLSSCQIASNSVIRLRRESITIKQTNNITFTLIILKYKVCLWFNSHWFLLEDIKTRKIFRKQ